MVPWFPHKKNGGLVATVFQCCGATVKHQKTVACIDYSIAVLLFTVVLCRIALKYQLFADVRGYDLQENACYSPLTVAVNTGNSVRHWHYQGITCEMAPIGVKIFLTCKNRHMRIMTRHFPILLP